MNIGERRSRYDCVGNPPPNLKGIFKAITKRSPRGYLNTTAEIRAAAASADDEYGEKGVADELQRFLRHRGVILDDETDGRFYFDPKRAEVVIAACESRTEPSLIPDRLARLVQLKFEAQHKIKSTSSDFDEDHGTNGTGTVVPPANNGGSGNDGTGTIVAPALVENTAGRDSFLPEDAEDWSWILNSDLRPYSVEEIGASTDSELEEHRSKLDRFACLIESSRSRVNAEVKRRIEEKLSYIQAERAQYEQEIAELQKKERELLARLPAA